MVGHASERSRRRRREVGETPREESKEKEKIRLDEQNPEDPHRPRETRGPQETESNTEGRLQRVIDNLEVQERSEETVSERMERALGSLEDERPTDSSERSTHSTEERMRNTIDRLEEPVGDSEPELEQNPDGLRDEDEVRFRSMEEIDETLANNPEIELRKDFEERYEVVETYIEKIQNGENPEKPDLIIDLERLEIQKLYEEANHGPPEVQINSMQDFRDLSEKYAGQVQISEKDYEEARKYFEIRNESGKSQHQLAEEYGYSQSKISNIRRGVETGAIKELRTREEERIIKEWSDSQETSPRPTDSSEIEREKRELTIDESGLQKVQSQSVREAFQDIKESKDVSRISIEDAVERIIISSEQEARMRMSDLSNSGLTPEEIAKVRATLEEHRVKIQGTLEQRTGLEKVRIGIVRDRLYVWTPDMTPNDMINVWHDQYFYMNGRDMSEISDMAGRRLELGDSRRERLKYLNDLMNQMMDNVPTSDAIKIDGDRSRMLGEALNIQRDVLGIQNRDLEGRVRKVTGINGHGGISNPKFPRGQRLETWRAGLIGSVLSDGHIRSDDMIVEYYEENLERMNRFRESMKEIGDFTNEPSFDPRCNLYRLKLPNPYGRALNYWGVPSGDKAIKNPGLPSDFRKWSHEAKCNYGSEMESEESSVTTGRCVWPRHNAIKIGIKKSNSYESRKRISKREVDLIRDRGVTRAGDFEGQKTILYSSLEDLKKDSNPEIAKTAQRLERTIHNNRNNLIDSEKELYSDLGIDVTVTPRLISLYSSGRVSIKWEARTSDSSATIRLGIMCPPNHPEKEVVLKKWIDTRNPEKVQSVLEDIENDGFTIPNKWRINETEETGG